MIDIGQNYPLAIITSTGAIAVIAKGDREGHAIAHLRFLESGNNLMAESPVDRNVDGSELTQMVLEALGLAYDNVEVFDVPAGLTPKEFLAWGIEQDLLTVTGTGMIH